MKVLYVSPSLLPSRAANSIHVISQSKGFIENGYEIELFCQRTIFNKLKFKRQVSLDFGSLTDDINFKSIFSPFSRLSNFLIAFYFLIIIFLKNEKYSLIISRNFYASLFITILNINHVYETHLVEKGIKSKLQKFIILSPKTKVVVISQKLQEILENKFKLKFKAKILHDAAFSESDQKSDYEKKRILSDYVPEDKIHKNFIAGYFGHLYEGRGIEIIIGLAECNPNMLFLVFGGTEDEIKKYRQRNKLNNLLFVGHVSHSKVKNIMQSLNCLLMPYQKSVKISGNVDTAEWMSPMKMFEYMSSGVPIISSDLPVLKEVLIDMNNCLMATPDHLSSWNKALNLLKTNSELSSKLSKKAKLDQENKFTWRKRANQIIELMNE